MARVKALFFLAVLLCSTLVYAARPEPAFSAATSAKTQLEVCGIFMFLKFICAFSLQGYEFDMWLFFKFFLGVEQGVETEVDESCEGAGEEECLMRRTLAAHVDYIYTQKHNP